MKRPIGKINKKRNISIEHLLSVFGFSADRYKSSMLEMQKIDYANLPLEYLFLMRSFDFVAIEMLAFQSVSVFYVVDVYK